jgi:1,4-alpha-glucan branching enzyme
MHAGMHAWVTELNRLYATAPELHATDGDGRGFEWLDCHDKDRTTLAFLRWSPEWASHLVFVANFAAVTWKGYRLAVPSAGRYEVVLCSDDGAYGGAGTLVERSYETVAGELHGREQHIEITLPALSVVCFGVERGGG